MADACGDAAITGAGSAPEAPVLAAFDAEPANAAGTAQETDNPFYMMAGTHAPEAAGGALGPGRAPLLPPP
jgi:hypothetical protein